MKLKIQDIKGKSQGELEVKFEMIADGRGTQAVHDAVVAFNAAQRMGTACTKTAGEVAGTNKKPWKQKGTGRARAGSNRSPLWTGGGAVFGPQPRSYTFKVNRKEQRAALRSALSLHAGRGSIAILGSGAISEPKTAHAAELLEDWEPTSGPAHPVLVVLTPEESSAALSFRNLARVSVLTPENVGVSDLVGAASVIVSEPALEQLSLRTAPPRGASGES